MGLFNPSVLKEYRKRAEAATKLTKQKNEELIAVLERCVPIIENYKKARVTYQNLLTTFGVAKFNAIAEGKAPMPTTPPDLPAITAVLQAGDRVMELGDGYIPADTDMKRAHRELEQAVNAEKAAYQTIAKYLQDKETMKGLGDVAYKKWKKELRADLF
jgi:hypothetical protein